VKDNSARTDNNDRTSSWWPAKCGIPFGEYSCRLLQPLDHANLASSHRSRYWIHLCNHTLVIGILYVALSNLEKYDRSSRTPSCLRDWTRGPFLHASKNTRLDNNMQISECFRLRITQVTLLQTSAGKIFCFTVATDSPTACPSRWAFHSRHHQASESGGGLLLGLELCSSLPDKRGIIRKMVRQTDTRKFVDRTQPLR
jgi:hypothetical protein